MEQLRRIVFALVIFFAAFFVFATWRSGREGYGLIDLLKGRKPDAQQFTTPAAPKLALDDVQVLAKLDEESSKLAASVLPCVVSVNTKTVIPGRVYVNPFFGNYVRGRSTTATGLGSGAFISKEGHIITNYHVIDGVTEIQITTNDGKKYPARIVGTSRERDLALLKVERAGNDFPALSFADSDKARVGQLVFAVGNPFGLTGSVTQGIISARDRHLSDSQLDYLQTDTVINPGNSGGPLVNIRGEILGINVAIYQGGEQTRAWQGVGLAIPSNEAKNIVNEIIAQAGSGTRSVSTTGFLGLALHESLVRIDRSIAGGGVGLLITEIVPNSPAMLAGLQVDDVILDFGGRRFSDPNDLFEMIRKTKPGTKVTLNILRNGEPMKVIATIGDMPKGRGDLD